MKKPYQSYTETVDYKGDKLAVTINVFKEPCAKTEDKEFYTFIEITKDGRAWGRLFYEDPTQEKDFSAEIQNVAKNIELFKTMPDEFN